MLGVVTHLNWRINMAKIIIRPEMLNGKQKEYTKDSIKRIIKENSEVFKKLE